VFTVLGVRMKNLSWLFGAAWICSIPIAVILCRGINGRKFRYSVTLGTLAVIALFFFWLDRATRPKEEPEKVSLEIKWQVPEPIDSKTPLSANQLNASAFADGHPVEGRFVYNPTRGSTLQSGIDTLSATFYPKDRDKYFPVQPSTVVIVVKPPPTPTIRKGPPITVASHQFLIKPSGTGYSAVLRIYLNNNIGVTLKTRDRSTTEVFNGPLNSPKRGEWEDSQWEEMDKREGNISELPTTPDTFKEFPLPDLSEQVLKQVSDGKVLLAFIVSIRSADDKKRLLELCGYANGPNVLMNCNKHNWP
jgi:hypothetical protein